jgi:hypothetical protein
MKSLLVAVAIAMLTSTSAFAQAYAEWYLDCTIVETNTPDQKIIGYDEYYKRVKAVKIVMEFDNGGNLNVEGAEIKHEMSDGDYRTPFAHFNTVRFDGGRQLITGVVTWRGSEPRYFPGWSMTGEVKEMKKEKGMTYDVHGTYTETFSERIGS